MQEKSGPTWKRCEILEKGGGGVGEGVGKGGREDASRQQMQERSGPNGKVSDIFRHGQVLSWREGGLQRGLGRKKGGEGGAVR